MKNDLRPRGLTPTESGQLLALVIQLAAFNDAEGSTHLRRTGSFSAFDEPNAVRLSRELLTELGIPHAE